MTMHYTNADWTFIAEQAARWAAEDEAKAVRERKRREGAELAKHGIPVHFAVMLDG